MQSVFADDAKLRRESLPLWTPSANCRFRGLAVGQMLDDALGNRFCSANCAWSFLLRHNPHSAAIPVLERAQPAVPPTAPTPPPAVPEAVVSLAASSSTRKSQRPDSATMRCTDDANKRVGPTVLGKHLPRPPRPPRPRAPICSGKRPPRPPPRPPAEVCY